MPAAVGKQVRPVDDNGNAPLPGQNAFIESTIDLASFLAQVRVTQQAVATLDPVPQRRLITENTAHFQQAEPAYSTGFNKRGDAVATLGMDRRAFLA
jgi:hypothetical protein